MAAWRLEGVPELESFIWSYLTDLRGSSCVTCRHHAIGDSNGSLLHTHS